MHFLKISGFLICSVFLLSFLLQGCFSFRTSDKKAKEEFRNAGVNLKTECLEINENKIHYAKTGSDTLPTLLFVHGSPGSWEAFSEYMKDKDLLSKFRMISVDRPGFGFSDFKHALPLQQQGDIISQLIKTLPNNQPFYLVGHSLGGPLVALLAADNPADVTGIIILAGALDPSLEPKEKWRPIIGSFPLKYLLPGAFRPSNQELWYLKKDLYPLKEKLKLITCKVYILHGEKDVLVDVKNVDFMKAEFIHAKSLKDTIFPNENHFIPWTRFKEIKQLLKNLDNEPFYLEE